MRFINGQPRGISKYRRPLWIGEIDVVTLYVGIIQADFWFGEYPRRGSL